MITIDHSCLFGHKSKLNPDEPILCANSRSSVVARALGIDFPILFGGNRLIVERFNIDESDRWETRIQRVELSLNR
jgi:hypothetical protein